MGKGQASLMKGKGTATIIYCEPFHAAQTESDYVYEVCTNLAIRSRVRGW